MFPSSSSSTWHAIIIEPKGAAFRNPKKQRRKAPKVALKRNTGTTKFSRYGSGKGRYFGRRASDSTIVSVTKAKAVAVIKRKGDINATPKDYLAIWWVPSEYNVGEAKWRVQRGWIKPLWDWGRGRLAGGGACT